MYALIFFRRKAQSSLKIRPMQKGLFLRGISDSWKWFIHAWCNKCFCNEGFGCKCFWAIEEI